MKGIVLAGGLGTRMAPITQVVNKQLLPIYDKPMIYYPISVLMLAGITDILLIGTEESTPQLKKLLGDGSQFGINFNYASQQSPGGISEAFIIGKDFIKGDSCILILGDNFFYGHGLASFFENATQKHRGASIFTYWVSNPSTYGVIEEDESENIIDIVEKPEYTKSNWAITGLYIFDHKIADIVKSLVPSERGELEITDALKVYLSSAELYVTKMGRGFAWLDTGTSDSLLQTSLFVQTIEKRQGLKIACLEEIALRKGFITPLDFKSSIDCMPTCTYRDYLNRVLSDFSSHKN